MRVQTQHRMDSGLGCFPEQVCLTGGAIQPIFLSSWWVSLAEAEVGLEQVQSLGNP